MRYFDHQDFVISDVQKMDVLGFLIGEEYLNQLRVLDEVAFSDRAVQGQIWRSSLIWSLR